jgi:anti-sigma B factor antagonist
VTTIQVSGDINVYSASVLGEAIQSLIADGVRSIVIDLSAVQSIDSSGLGTLVGNARSMASAGGSISLNGVTDRLRRTLTITNLDRYFSIGGGAGDALGERQVQVAGASSKEAM